jgi:hypothetical protein
MEKELLISSTGTGSFPSTSTTQNLQLRVSPTSVGLEVGVDGDVHVGTENLSLDNPGMTLPQYPNPVSVGSGLSIPFSGTSGIVADFGAQSVFYHGYSLTLLEAAGDVLRVSSSVRPEVENQVKDDLILDFSSDLGLDRWRWDLRISGCLIRVPAPSHQQSAER